MERTVTLIPARRDKNEKNVGIYCRVSSSSKEQLDSLTEQIAALTRQVSQSANGGCVIPLLILVPQKATRPGVNLNGC